MFIKMSAQARAAIHKPEKAPQLQAIHQGGQSVTTPTPPIGECCQSLSTDQADICEEQALDLARSYALMRLGPGPPHRYSTGLCAA